MVKPLSTRKINQIIEKAIQIREEMPVWLFANGWIKVDDLHETCIEPTPEGYEVTLWLGGEHYGTCIQKTIKRFHPIRSHWIGRRNTSQVGSPYR